MVSRYTPAHRRPLPPPSPRGTRAFSRCLPPSLADGLPRSPATTAVALPPFVLSPLPGSGEPCFAAPLEPPPRFAREASRDVSTVDLSDIADFFMGSLPRSMSRKGDLVAPRRSESRSYLQYTKYHIDVLRHDNSNCTIPIFISSF